MIFNQQPPTQGGGGAVETVAISLNHAYNACLTPAGIQYDNAVIDVEDAILGSLAVGFGSLEPGATNTGVTLVQSWTQTRVTCYLYEVTG